MLALRQVNDTAVQQQTAVLGVPVCVCLAQACE